MPASGDAGSLEEQIGRWRSYLRRRQAIHSADLAELEDHLREQIAVLADAGLATDEAFLVAVKRMGNLDALSREFAHEYWDHLWKQLVIDPSDSGDLRARALTDAVIAFCLAAAAAVVIKVPALFGMRLDQDAGFYVRNLSLFVLPLLTGYFVWKRRLDSHTVRWLAVAFVAAGVFANVSPFDPGGYTERLTALHLPIALWLVVGIAYAGGRWGQVSGRMDFIRFSGELFIYYVLIALGGGVLTAFMAMLYQAIGIDVEPFFKSWLLPCGAVGAVVVASWLVEAKQSVIENMAPVLTRLFTPLFAAVLVAFLGTLLWTGRGVDIERNVLIAFDLLLVLVLGLLLYSLSARDAQSPPGAFDGVQVVLVVCALLADAVALWAIAARITEFGFTPNRVAALGENLILLVNLAWSAVLSIRFLRGGGSFTDLERWQTNYLPVYAVWAAIVVIVFPPVFRSIGASPATAQPGAGLVQQLDSLAGAGVRENRAVGIVAAVVKGKDTLLLKAYGKADVEGDVPMTVNTMLPIGSVTKQFTAAAVLQLRDQGKLSLDDDITKWLPDFETRGNRVTLRHLLGHTSGIANLTEMPELREMRLMRNPTATREDVYKVINRYPFQFPTGTMEIYSNTNFWLLGLIIEKASGMTYEEYVEKKIFEPLGMTRSMYCKNAENPPRRAYGYGMRSGTPRRVPDIVHTGTHAAGAICSTAGDMIRWLQALHGGKVLSPRSYAEMIRPSKLNDGTPLRYAMGLTVGEDSHGLKYTGHNGGGFGFSSEARWFPGGKLAIVVLTNSEPDEITAVTASLAAAVLPVPRPAGPFTDNASPLVGTYKGLGPGGDTVVEVTQTPAGIAFSIRGAPAAPLAWVARWTFRRNDSLLTFRRSANSGPATELVFDTGGDHFILRRQ